MLKSIYYWSYQLLRKINRKESDLDIEYSATVAANIFVGMNALTAYFIADYFLRLNLPVNTGLIIVIILGLVIWLFHYFYLFRNREDIFRAQEHKPPTKRQKEKVLFFFYLIITLGSFWSTAALLGHSK